MIPCSVEDIENEVYNKTSLIIFTGRSQRTHGKSRQIRCGSRSPVSPSQQQQACGAGLWPTGLLAHRLASAAASPGDAPFWCWFQWFEFRKAKFASTRHERLVRINVSAIVEGLYLVSVNAHFDCAIWEVVISLIHASTIRTSLDDLESV